MEYLFAALLIGTVASYLFDPERSQPTFEIKIYRELLKNHGLQSAIDYAKFLKEEQDKGE